MDHPDRAETQGGTLVLQVLGKVPEKAIALLAEALNDDPQAPDPRYWLARAYQDEGQLEEARKAVTRATELDEHFADAFYLLGDLEKNNDKEKARASFKRYLELDPSGSQVKSAKHALAVLK